jgi:hypothetical protein
MAQPLPEYSTEQDEDTRESNILHILTLIAGASALTWWTHVRRRMHGVILYVWLRQEAALLLDRYIIPHIHLIYREEWRDTPIDDICVDIILRIRGKLPQPFRPFYAFTGAKTRRAKEKAAKAELVELSKWYRIQRDVGWFAIVFNKAFNAEIIEKGSEADINKLIQVLSNFRPKLLELINICWPGHPRILFETGGNCIPIILAYHGRCRDTPNE